MKTVSRAVKTSCILAVVWCLSGLASPMAQAQVLDQIPSDSLIVIKVNHLQETNTKVSDLLTSLGLTDLIPTMKDPLATVETQLGIGPGLDSKRDAAAVVLNGTFEPAGPPPFVLVLPVSDYKAFIGFHQSGSHRRRCQRRSLQGQRRRHLRRKLGRLRRHLRQKRKRHR